MNNKSLQLIYQKVLSADEHQRDKILAELPSEQRRKIEDLLQSDNSDLELVENPQPRGLQSKERAGIPHLTLEKIRDYELVELIGEGGMGSVYKALHSRLQRHVAIKLLPQFQQRHAAETIARFNREMAVVGRLQHPNIVQASDAGEEDGVHYLVLELVEGADLSRILRKAGSLSIPDAAEIIRQAGLGLQNAHDHGLVHRDIKPANLLVSNTGVVKIADMGLALLNDHGELTSTGQVMGTMDYIAPEQIASAHDVDSRADLYSLGCTLYKLLSGRAPFAVPESESLLQKIQAHTSVVPVPIRKLRVEVPVEIEKILKRLLAKDPQKRFASAQELVEAITPFTSGAQIARLAERAEGADNANQNTVVFLPSQVETDTNQNTTHLNAPRSAAPTKKRTRQRVMIALLCLFGLTAALFTPQILRIVTNKGEVVINNQEGVDVQITQGEEDPIMIHDKVADRRYTLNVGDDYHLTIKDPETGTEFKSEAFSIKRNGVVVFDARAEIAKAEPIPADSDIAESNIADSTNKKATGTAPPPEIAAETKPDIAPNDDSDQTQRKICGQLLSRKLVDRVDGMSRGRGFSAKTIDDLPRDLREVSRLKVFLTIESADSTRIEEVARLGSQIDLDGLYIYGSFSPTVAALQSLADQKPAIYYAFLSHFSVPNLAALPEGAFAYPVKLSIKDQIADKDLHVILERFPKLESLSMSHPDIDDNIALKAFPGKYLSLAAQDEMSESTTLAIERIKNIQILKVTFSPEYQTEPLADYSRLPLDFEELDLFNTQLNPKQLGQLKRYKSLKTITQDFASWFKRKPTPLNSETLADFQQARPDVTLQLSTPLTQPPTN